MSNEQRIRELAYQIWEAEGRPDGQEERHWGLAHKLASEAVATEAVATEAAVTPPARVSRSRPRAAADNPTPAPSRRGGNGRTKKTEQPR